MKEVCFRSSVLHGKALEVLDRILYSEGYLALVCTLVLLFWATGAMISGFTVMCLLLSALLVLKRDLTPCLPVIVSIYCIVSVSEFPPYFVYMFAILIPVAGALIFHFVYYPVKKPTAGAFGLAYLCVAASMFMGGAFTDATTDKLKALGFAAFLGLFPFAVYVLIRNYCCEKPKRQFVEYAGKSFAFLGLLIVLQLLVYYIRVWTGVLPGGEVHLGWGISNGAASVLLVTAPITMYVAVSRKNGVLSLLYAALSAVQYVGVVATVSRGAIIFGAISFVILLVATIVKTPYKKTYIAAYVAGAVVVGVCVAVFREEFKAFFDKAFETGLSSSGRDALYSEAWEVFKQNPFFGVGFGYSGRNAYLNRHPMYYFHSTLFQTVASLGLFGLAASVYMYYKRVRFAFSKGLTYNVFWIIACVGVEGYAMINTFTFLAVPGLLLIAVATAVNETSNAARKEEDSEKALAAAAQTESEKTVAETDGAALAEPPVAEESERTDPYNGYAEVSAQEGNCAQESPIQEEESAEAREDNAQDVADGNEIPKDASGETLAPSGQGKSGIKRDKPAGGRRGKRKTSR